MNIIEGVLQQRWIMLDMTSAIQGTDFQKAVQSFLVWVNVQSTILFNQIKTFSALVMLKLISAIWLFEASYLGWHWWMIRSLKICQQNLHILIFVIAEHQLFYTFYELIIVIPLYSHIFVLHCSIFSDTGPLILSSIIMDFLAWPGGSMS